MKLTLKIVFISCILIVLIALYFKVDNQIEKYISNNGIDDTSIVVGQTIDLSGKIIGSRSFHLGFTTAIDRYNNNGGINGRKIIYYVLDDNNDTERAIENCKLLLNFYNCFCLFGTYGEECTHKIIPYITDYGVPLFAPSSGSLEIREPFNKFIINSQASYYNEIIKILSFMSNLKLYNFSLIYDNTNKLIKVLEKILILNDEMKNFNLVSYAVIDEDDSLYKSFSSIIGSEHPFDSKINSTLENIDFILICSSENNVANIIKYFKRLKPTLYCFYLSSVNTVYTASLIRKYLPEIQNIYATTISYKDSSTSIYKEYQTELNLNNYKNIETKMSFKSLSGYISGKHFCETLLQLGNNLNRDAFIAEVYKNQIKFNDIEFNKFEMNKSNQGINDCYLYKLTNTEGDVQLVEDSTL